MDWPARVAIAMAATFLVIGVYMPFWPVWLESRGLSPEATGVALGLGGWARVFVNPWVGRWADRSGRTRGIAVAMTLGAVAVFVAFVPAHGTAWLLVLSVGLGAFFAPIVPLVDTLAVRGMAAGRGDYGRVRRWGSLAFIAGSAGVGALLEEAAPDAILYTVLGATALMAVAVALLPSVDAPPRPALAAVGPFALLRDARFRMLLLATAALQGSHAMLYAFGTTHWLSLGIDESTIGWLWAEGVVAEIVLFSYGPWLMRRLSPAGLLIVGGLGGVVRWTLLGVTGDLAVLAVVQLLHAATFAATHLGAMSYVRTHIDPDSTGSANALYSAVALGLAFGVSLPLAGTLYDALAGHAYWVMSAVSLAGIAAAVALRSRLGPVRASAP